MPDNIPDLLAQIEWLAAEDLTNPETIAAINRAAWALIGLTEAR